MADLKDRIKNLSPEQKALLEKKLREKAIKKATEDKIRIRENLNEYPMSSAQERLWFLHQSNPNSGFYNIPAAIKITGKLNIDALKKSLNAVVKRHQILSVVFNVESNKPIQKIKEFDFDISIEDLSENNPNVNKIINNEAETPFNIEEGPLYRIKILKLNKNEHILLLTLHHIVADGWSIGILINELSQNYDLFSQDNTSPFYELPIQYFDYSNWRNNFFTKENEDKELNFWKEKLTGMPQVLELPYDRARPTTQSFNGDRYYFEIPNELAESIKKIGQANGASPFMTFLSVLQILLYKYSNQNDFGIGTLISDRQRSETKDLLGFFVNTLVMRAEIDGNKNFNELLKKVKDYSLDAFQHQYLPFEKVVGNLLEERSSSISPLFQVMFDFQEAPFKKLNMHEISLEVIELEMQIAKFELLFILEDSTDRITGVFEFSTDIYYKETIKRFANSYLVLLENIIKSPQQSIENLSIISKKEEQQIIDISSTILSTHPKEYCIHHLFEQQAEANPTNIAVEFTNEILSYSKLNKKSNQLARYLISKGVNNGDLIGIHLERGANLIISILAVLKLGGAYLPMDPIYPKDRLEFMLEDSKVKILITENKLSKKIISDEIEPIIIDKNKSEIEKEKSENIEIKIEPEQTAYVIYTSGSTGKPKGTIISHFNVVRLFQSSEKIFEFDSDDVWTLFHSYSFDFSVWEIWGALIYGGKLIVVSSQVSKSPTEFYNLLKQKNVTVLNQTPTAFYQLITEEENKNREEIVTSLRYVVFGGESLDFTQLKPWVKNHGYNNPRLINMYGITETTVHVTYKVVSENDINSLNNSNIGVPLPDLQLYILDKNMRPQQIGVPGEICVSGSGLAKGYLFRDDLTNQKFIEHPFDENNKLYRSGDLGRYLENGDVEYLGRIDNQVKLRGFRIELGEIETVLSNNSEIKKAIVLLHGDTEINKKLVAFYISNKNSFVELEKLKKEISKKLPDYMMPVSFIKIESIPITGNGKLDKKKLLAKVIETENTKSENYVAPRNDLEKLLIKNLEDILEKKNIGINDNFFNIGGNSIQAAVFANNLQKEFNETFHVGAIFFAPTIYEIANHFVEYFPEKIKEKFDDDIIRFYESKNEYEEESKNNIDKEKINKFTELLPKLTSRKENGSSPKNKRAVFILSSPRSGSTLLRVMLNGNQSLFSPPELELMGFSTLKERSNTFTGEFEALKDGLTRAIMELQNINKEEALKLLEQFEENDLSVKDTYGEIQNLLDDKILIDKTPIYSLNQEILERIEKDFEDALFIHLVRHPYAVIHSFVEAKMKTYAFRKKMPFNLEELAELVWYKSNTNIENFLKKIPYERKYELKFSNLVLNSEKIMKEISDFIGVEYNANMLNPYAEKNMTDGIKENVPMVGDLKYYIHKKIDSNVLDKWKKNHKRNYLGNESRQLSEKYEFDTYGIDGQDNASVVKLTENKIQKFGSIIRPIKKWEKEITKNIPKTIFILSPPRSGSTLLRVMLEGHTKLFSPPELDLLTFNTLGERKEMLQGKLSLWLEATVRAIMELKNCSADEATEIMNDLENKNIHISEFYTLLHEWSDNKILVDKTPTYSLDLQVLERAEEYFDKPLYIHLTRSPYPSIYSSEKASLQDTFFRYKNECTERELAELVWMKCHENTIDFLENIPEERKIKLKFEDLVLLPEQEMKRLSNFIGIDYDGKLVTPYEGTRMTDPINESSQMVGDFKFYIRNKIDPKVNARWKKEHKTDFLCNRSKDLALKLGYTNDDIIISREKTLHNKYTSIDKVSRESELPLSFAQQRLWFLEQLEPGKTTYNIPGVVRAEGNLNIEILEKSINTIIDRHESLRTIFTTEEGKAKQVILKELKINIQTIDLTNYDEKIKDIETQKLIVSQSQKPFDLSKGPLLRAELLKIADNDNYLLITMHHIISDGWSSEIFIKELSIIYSSLLQGRKVHLNKLKIQYVDFASWQRNVLQSEIYKKQLEYWKNKLNGSTPLLKLPNDFTRPVVQSGKGQRLQFEINSKLIEKVNELRVRESTTTYSILLTVFNILLKTYSNTNDIPVGTPIAGRTRKEIEPLIGFFVNTLVLRNDLSNNPTFIELLARVKTVFTEAINNQDIPFEKLVDELQVERSLSYSPLFQVMFVFNNSPFTNIELEGLTLTPKALDLGAAKFDITLVLTKRNERIRGSIEFNKDIFAESTIKKFIEHYQNILEYVIDNPYENISDINILTKSEIDKINLTWNNTNANYQNQKTLHQIFEEKVEDLKYNIALVYDQNQLTYEELNIKANQIAAYLIDRGINKEDIIGVYMNSGIEAIISILGILKAGGTYLALDPSYPLKRLEYMVNDCDVKIIFSNDNVETELYISAPVVNINQSSIFESKLKNNPKIVTTGDNLAYIVYTSGSTGQPKGVALTHAGVLNQLNDFHLRKPLEEGKKSSLWTSLNFDVSVYEIFYPLLYAGELHIIPEDIRLLDVELFEWLAENRIANCYLPPFKLEEFSNWLKTNAANCRVEKLLSGVESIKSEIFYQIQKKLPDLQILNGYGPAETTICSTVFEYEQNKYQVGNAPIGKPMFNTKIYLLDKFMKIVPIGVSGEIYIESVGMARGYIKSMSNTAEKFIPNPFATDEGTRIYKTGDIGKYLPDGNIMFMGRSDSQVKLRGFRIELGEIESSLNQYNGIKNSIVLIREDDPGEKKLVAYYIKENNKKISNSNLKDYVSSKLPHYMIPFFYIELETFPLLPNKKINHKAFPKPELTRETIETEFVTSTTEVENTLVDVWKEILKVEKIGITDNFFELGGDSILGIQVIAKANQAGIKISPKNLFQFPTIQGLASVAESTKEIVAEQEILSGEVGLTPIQKWFFLQEFKNKNHWNQSILLEVNDKLEKELLQETISKLIEHHDALRMRFEKINDVWIQRYSPINDNIPFEHFDLSQFSIENKIDEIEKHSKVIQSCLDIGSGSIFKCAYFDLGDNQSNRLLIVAHHLIIDGVSWRILTEDIQNIYSQLKMGTEVTLPSKTTSFKYWSKRLNDLIDDKEFMKQNDYWDKLSVDNLANKDKLSVPKINTESSVKVLPLSLDEKITEILIKEVPKKYHTEINDVLLTALVLTNSIINGKRKMNVSLEGHGREDLFDDVDISRTIGWFTTLYPVVLDLDASTTRVESLKGIKEQLRKIPNNGIGFGILRHLLSENKKNSDMSHLPETSFNYLGQFNQSNDKKAIFSVAKENKSYERALENNRPFQMDISGSITNGKLNLNWMYNENKYSEEEIKLFSDTYVQELTKLIVETVSESGGYTPSDFNDVDLDDQDLDSIFSELNEEFDDE